MKVVFSLLLLVTLATAYDAPTGDEMLAMIATIKSEVLTTGEIYGQAIRLTFHDCVGGCDGCIDPSNHENVGLDGVVDALEDAWTTSYSDVVSRADFWALAGAVAIDQGIQGSNKDCPRIKKLGKTYCALNAMEYTFQWGRSDADDSTPYCSASNPIPAVSITTTAVFDFFQEEFDMGVTETVALMGAHNIGGTHPEWTGFIGNWLNCSIRQWNNRYYEIMLWTSDVVAWTQKARDENSQYNQWMGFNTTTDSRAGIMLATDWAMMYENEVDDSGTAWMNCNPQYGEATCAKSAGYDLISEYAHDYDGWMADFTPAYMKMQANGYTNLQDAYVFDTEYFN